MQNRIDSVKVRFVTLYNSKDIANLEHTLVMHYGIENLYNEVIPEGNYLVNINTPF